MSSVLLPPPSDDIFALKPNSLDPALFDHANHNVSGVDTTRNDGIRFKRPDLDTVNLDTIFLDQETPITLTLHAIEKRAPASRNDNDTNPITRPPLTTAVENVAHDEAQLTTYAAAAANVVSVATPISIEPSLELESSVEVVSASAANEEPSHGEVQFDSDSALNHNTKAANLLRDRYQLDEAISSGGSAIIYRAHDLRRASTQATAPAIAVKLLKPECRDDERAIDRLKREYEYTLKLVHPNIVRVLDLDRCDQQGWFITMELMEGESLTKFMRRSDAPPAPMSQAMQLISDCGSALSFAHQHGIFHCDFKPGNVIVTQSGTPCVIDFGAAYTIGNESNETHQRAAAATPAYASPQVLAGENIDARDDLFSLACVAYELLTGHHPFGYRSAADANNNERTLPRPSGLLPQQWHALQCSLSKSREARPASVAAFLRMFTEKPRRDLRWIGAGSVAIIASVLALVISNSLLTHPEANRQQMATSTASAASVMSMTSSSVAAATLIPAIAAGEPAVTNLPNEPVAPNTASTAVGDVTPGSTTATTNDENAVPAEKSARKQRLSASAVPVSPRDAIDFEQSKIVVSSLAVAAALTVTRSDARSDARIAWRAIDGSAHVGVDYEPLSTSTAVFAKHQTRRTIYINLKNNPGATGERHFAVEVHSVGNHDAKSWARAEVTIRHTQ